MKKLMLNAMLLLLSFTAIMLGGCNKTGNFPGADVSPYIAIYDLRSFYKGTDFALNTQSMLGATGITGVVVSDHSGKNLTPGLLMVQDKLRLNELRGIAINIGADADKYVPGDSVIVNLTGGVMKRVDGLLQVNNVNASAVTKVASGVSIPINRVPSSYILADPDKYESTELVIVKGGFDPIPAPTDTYKGDKLVNDGFGDFTLHTEAAATFANTPLPGMANFFGVIQYAAGTDGKYTPQLRIRKLNDITVLSSTITQAAIVISGFVTDVEGTDLNGEYIQLLATRDIDFSVTPFSLVTNNNTSSYTPTGFLTNGWATGGLRNYKFDLKTGKAAKGTYFYVGNTAKLINGVGSTSMAQGNWIVSKNYGGTPGDGFGTANTNLFINSGTYACGIAIFEGTTVTSTSVPIDVVFIGYNGSVLSNTNPPVGLRICNTDWYDIVNPVTLVSQPFYKQGSNTIALTYGTPADAGWYYKLGGEYNVRLGRWVKARGQRLVDLSKTSTIDELEKEFPVGDGTTEGLIPTKVVQ